MNKPSDDDSWGALRERVLGLGERSMRKSYYAGLQQRLRQLEHFRALVDAGSDALLMIRCSDGRITDSSRSAAMLLGRPLEQLLECTPDQIFAAAGAEAITQALREPSGAVVTTDSDLLPLDAEPIPVAVSVTRIDLADGGMALVAARDLRERLRGEAERREYERHALEGQRLESLGQLAGRIAHDFNNLIQVIFQHASLAQLDLEPENPAHEDLAQILEAAQVARGLTREMTAYAGGGERRRSEVDLAQLTQQMANLLKSAVGRRATLAVSSGEFVPAVEADASQLRQVLLNLVVNSAEAAAEGRATTIEVHTDHVADAQARGWEPALGNRIAHGRIETPCAALLTVRDSGCGIPLATLSRVFEPFFTTKPEGKGFGLATVLGIVRAHGGALVVDSAVGEGTRIEILLPCARPEDCDRCPRAPAR
jgi:two-component system cell cycle sensor histidine kinase/response regulator CckA